MTTNETENCIFCRIASGEVKSKKLYDSELFFIIEDIEPKAKHHYLAIPKVHYKNLSEMGRENATILGHILLGIGQFTSLLNLQNGYRLIINQGEDGGQTVNHMHIHILAGQKMEFPGF